MATPTPRKTGLKVVFGSLFSDSKEFFVGWDWFFVGNRLQQTQPNQILREHPITCWYWCMLLFYVSGKQGAYAYPTRGRKGGGVGWSGVLHALDRLRSIKQIIHVHPLYMCRCETLSNSPIIGIAPGKTCASYDTLLL